MDLKPIIAVILRVFIFLAFQFLSYKTYGLPALVGAWAIIVIATWVDAKTTRSQIAQTIVQSAWFVYLLAVMHSGRASF